MPNNFKKNIAIGSAFLIFLHHMICTLLHLAPYNSFTHYYSKYEHAYMDPIFSQKWHIFAPEPRMSELRMLYRCNERGNWSAWIDPLEKELQTHRKLRMFYHGKMSFAFTPSLNILKGSYPHHTIDYQAKEMNAIIVMAKNQCLDQMPEALSFQYKLQYKEVISFSQRNDGRVEQVEVFEFPEKEFQTEFHYAL